MIWFIFVLLSLLISPYETLIQTHQNDKNLSIIVI